MICFNKGDRLVSKKDNHPELCLEEEYIIREIEVLYGTTFMTVISVFGDRRYFIQRRIWDYFDKSEFLRNQRKSKLKKIFLGENDKV